MNLSNSVQESEARSYSMLPEPRYVHDRAKVIAALTSEDCTYILDTRDQMALRADAKPLVGGELCDPTEVYDVVSRPDWTWPLNARAKYIWMTSRGGKVYMADRNRANITMDGLRFQFGRRRS